MANANETHSLTLASLKVIGGFFLFCVIVSKMHIAGLSGLSAFSDLIPFSPIARKRLRGDNAMQDIPL